MVELVLGLRLVALVLAVACYGSFVWAALHLFRRNGPVPSEMQWLSTLGTIFFVIQILLLAVTDLVMGLLLVGIILYAGSIALLWWAVPYVRKAHLALAFTESQSTMLLQTGPYRWVRHPVYCSYFLFWIAGVIATGQHLLVISVLVMGTFYIRSIRHEERELLLRPDLPGYATYRAKTGCLLPRWRKSLNNRDPLC